eukprot:g4513.t1
MSGESEDIGVASEGFEEDESASFVDDGTDVGQESGDDDMDDSDYNDEDQEDAEEIDVTNVRHAKFADKYDFRKSKGMNEAHVSHPTLRLVKYCGEGNTEIETVGVNYPPYLAKEVKISDDAEVTEIENTKRHCYFNIGGKVHEYNCVRNSWHRSGFRRTTSFNKMNAYWGRHCSPSMFRALQKLQKVNHFPGTYIIGRKDRLGQILGVMHRRFGEAYSIHADTFVMPQDRRKIRAIWANDPRSLWIVKPSNSSCGRGIKVVNGHSNVRLSKGTIVQKYLSRPYLINNRKFDLRLYVCVTCYDPLRVYLYDDGLARFATCDYSRNPKHLKNRFMHLTNYSVNKNNEDFVKNDDANNCGVGSKWTLKALRRHFRENDVDDTKVMRDIQDVIVKTVIAAESTVASKINRYQLRRDNCFELYGFDVFLDDKLKPWVIEVNIAPSLSSSSPLDKTCKNNLLCDTYNLVGFKTGDPRQEKKKEAKAELERLHTKGSKSGPPRRRNVFALSEKSLACLPQDDRMMILEMEAEYNRKCNFQRIYPSFAPEVNDYYAQFYEAQRYNNTVCNLWIAACAKGRRPNLKPKKKITYKRGSTFGTVPRQIASAREGRDSRDSARSNSTVSGIPSVAGSARSSSESLEGDNSPPSTSNSSRTSSAGSSSSNANIVAMELERHEGEVETPIPPILPNAVSRENFSAPPNGEQGGIEMPFSRADGNTHPQKPATINLTGDLNSFDSGGKANYPSQKLQNGELIRRHSPLNTNTAAAGSGSRAVFQVRELQANPRLLTPPSGQRLSPSRGNGIYRTILPRQQMQSSVVLPRTDHPKTGIATKQQASGHIPQPPLDLHGRSSNSALSAREKRMTVSQWYKNKDGSSLVSQNSMKSASGRAAFTLNGKQTKINVPRMKPRSNRPFERIDM